VTSVTNVGWTPLFPRAAAVVTDIGAPLSHAAIVAREYGVPSVVNAEGVTRWVRTGEKIRVDGDRGVVTKLAC
jgi:pyruvate,water dikinase